MDPAIARTSPPLSTFEDGLGTRHPSSDAGGQAIEILTLRDELTAVPSFEFALRERASRLAGFRHASYAHVRGIDKTGSTLAVVSECVPGVRLSRLLSVAEQQLIPVEIDAALCVIRQLVQAVAMLHEQVPDVCHGAVALERIVITPNARAVVVEHVLGAALGQLLYSRERYWKDLRIAMPPRAGAPRFDRRADVTQVGAVSLALILGRPLGADDYPMRVAEMVERVGAVSATGGLEPLPEGVRTWLARALQLDPRSSFASAIEARAELDAVLRDADYAAAPSALESLVAQYDACVPVNAPSTPVVASIVPSIAPKPQPVSTPKSATSSGVQPKLELTPSPAPMPASKPPVPPPPAAEAKNEPVVTRMAPSVAPASLASIVHGEDEELERNDHHELPDELEAKHRPAPRRSMIAVAAAVVVLAIGGAFAARYFQSANAAPATGTLVVTTNPAGVAVAIDGKPSGSTPITASLGPGEHLLEIITGDGERRKIPVTITAGGQVSQFIELPKAAPAVGRLQVRSDPSGAKVTVDGHVFGRAPVTVEGLSPGVHVVALENDLGSVRESVTIEAGTTASLVVPMAAPQGAPVSGWITVSAPMDLQVFEQGRLIGSSRTDRIMVPVGRHELELSNEAVGYRATHVVNVSPGQVATVRPEWPKGALALNALPWADVFIDGKLIGETPIGNVTLPVGAHEVVFRHPELGEHRSTIIVTYGTPARLSVDLRKK